MASKHTFSLNAFYYRDMSRAGIVSRAAMNKYVYVHLLRLLQKDEDIFPRQISIIVKPLGHDSTIVLTLVKR